MVNYPILNVTKVGANNGEKSTQPLTLQDVRDFFVQFSATFGSGATGDAELRIFISLDGETIDTEPYDTLNLTVSAGETVTASAYIITPTDGFIQFVVRNKDTGVVLDSAKVICQSKKYLFPRPQDKGSTLSDTGEQR